MSVSERTICTKYKIQVHTVVDTFTNKSTCVVVESNNTCVLEALWISFALWNVNIHLIMSLHVVIRLDKIVVDCRAHVIYMENNFV